MTTAVVHPAVAAIRDAISAAMSGDLAGVVVLDAVDPSAQAYALRSVTVGGTWDPELQGFATDQAVLVESSEAGAARRSVETVAVQCIAYTGSGSRDFDGNRASVGAILGAISSALQGIQQVGTAGAMARISSQSWAQAIDGQGSLVLASFTVTVSLLT
jgi:hypothetical protein